MATLLALLSSVLWGSADFCGGLLTKKYKAFAVTAMSQFFGLITAILIIVASSGFIAPTLNWNGYFLPGIFAGIVGFGGLVSFYSGLSTGRMGVVSPISTLSTLIPLAVAFAGGERPRAIQFVGIFIVLVGVFCGSGPDIVKGLPLKPLLFGLGAALGFGTALALMAQGSKTSALMTMSSMRLATVTISILIAIKFRSLGGFKVNDLSLLIFIGITDFMANYLLGVATTKGLVSIAMVLGSLFPMMTALLAFKFLRERLHKVQYLGIILAVTGVSLISL